MSRHVSPWLLKLLVPLEKVVQCGYCWGNDLTRVAQALPKLNKCYYLAIDERNWQLTAYCSRQDSKCLKYASHRKEYISTISDCFANCHTVHNWHYQGIQIMLRDNITAQGNARFPQWHISFKYMSEAISAEDLIPLLLQRYKYSRVSLPWLDRAQLLLPP